MIPSARGLVPVSYFEIIGKTERQSTGSATSNASNNALVDSGYSEKGTHGKTESTSTARTPTHARMPSMSKGAMVYGIVQYDFNAERPDELEAKSGEAIIVIAQSNPEWFVAKPIGRLGGPGLIPVSFVEIRDMTTGRAVDDPQLAVQQAGVPKVEEWKRIALNYKETSIELGKFGNADSNANAASIQREMERMSLSNGTQHPGVVNGNAYVRYYLYLFARRHSRLISAGTKLKLLSTAQWQSLHAKWKPTDSTASSHFRFDTKILFRKR